MRLRTLTLISVSIFFVSGCPAGGECQVSSDCEPGQFCNRNSECQASYIPQALDAAAYERPPRRLDATVEDGGVEDGPVVDAAPGLDSSIAIDRRVVDAGLAQVSSFSVCNGPSAVELSDDALSLYVACLGSDEIRVYSSITGGERRNLSALESNCQPKALHLREDKNRLLVSCTSSGSNRVLDIHPATGANNRTSTNTAAAPSVRFASGGSLAAWSEVAGNNYALYNLDTGAAPTGGTLNQGGGGVAVKSDGSHVYLSQAQNQGNNVLVVDSSGGLVGVPMAMPFASTQFVALVPSSDLIAFANSQQLIRRNEIQTFGTVETVQSPRLIKALIATTTRFYVGSYDINAAKTYIYPYSGQSSTYPALGTAVMITGCELSDLAAADDGRVFAVCSNTNTIQVVTP